MIDLHEVYSLLAEVARSMGPRTGYHELATHTTPGRVLAEDVYCRIPSPPFNQSAMDGIAFSFSAAKTYQLIGTVAAGDRPDALKPGPGQCVRIMTGAPLPSSTDTVEMVEKIEVAGDQVKLVAQPRPGQHIRYAGENLKVGELLYPAGTVITPATLGGLVSQGLRYLKVQAPIRVGIASTGDEIIDYRQPLGPGQIYNSNAPCLTAALASAGVEVQQLGSFRDKLETLSACLAANSDLDVIVLTGGVSMGNFDLVPEAAELAGYHKIFHKIKMKPGKPLWFGADATTGTVLFGLPGNPVSALVGACLFVAPYLKALQQGSFQQPVWTRAQSGVELFNHSSLTYFSGGRLDCLDGETTVFPLTTSGSGDVVRFGSATCIMRLAPGSGVKRGDPIQIFLPFRW